jgi:hypothetical protein
MPNAANSLRYCLKTWGLRFKWPVNLMRIALAGYLYLVGNFINVVLELLLIWTENWVFVHLRFGRTTSFESFDNVHIHMSSESIKKISMVWVRERTIPTERPPPVGEVIANFCGQRVQRGQRDGSLTPYSRFSRQEPLLFYQVAPQLYSRGWVDPVPDKLLFFFSGSAGNRTRASGSVAKTSDQ